MLVKITKDYTYDLDKSAKRTLFKGSVYDEPDDLAKEIIDSGFGTAPDGKPGKTAEPKGKAAKSDAAAE